MPRAKDKPSIGTVACNDCGEPAPVKVNTKGYLYQGCKVCKVNQSIGKKYQEYLWNNTVFLEGMKPQTPPPNLITDQPKEPEAKPESLEGEVLPASDSEPKEEPTTEPKGKGLLGLAAAVLAVVFLPMGGGGA